MKRWLLIASSFIFLAFAVRAKEVPPNILFIIADQWRAQAFGYAGDPNVKTPHLDSLARTSVNFKNAVSSLPVCSPTRASILTGQRALTHGVFLNDVPLKNESVTLAEVLKNAGYDTAIVGKWHINGDGHRSSFIPPERRQGFDYWKVLECTHDYNDSFYFSQTPEKLKWEGYDAIAQTRDAQQYFRDHAIKTREKPFLFFLSWGPPHNPYSSAPEKYKSLYDPAKLTLRGNVPKGMEQQIRRDLAGYYAHCSALDDCVGDLLQTLRETGLAENTLIIFTSDHGDMLGSHSLVRKQKPWDESIRVPLLIRWPKKIKAREVETVFSSEDFMPTILGLCKIKAPKSVEGVDYSRALLGGKSPDNAALISCVATFGEWTRANGGKEFRGLRTPLYTYVRDLNGPWLLFDNETDPLQMTNLVGDPKQIKLQKNLDQALQKKLKESHDEFLPGDSYVRKWGYQTNSSGTVPYTN